MLTSSIYGFGQHNANLGGYDIMMATKAELIGQFSVSIAMGLSKAAVALLLLRIINVFWYMPPPYPTLQRTRTHHSIKLLRCSHNRDI